jgi:hypothetical protein
MAGNQRGGEDPSKDEKAEDDVGTGLSDTEKNTPETLPPSESTTDAASQKVPPEEQWDLLLDRLKTNATKDPTKRAMAFLAPGPSGGKIEHELTYAEVEQETSALAQRLLESGLKKGDRYVVFVMDET